ncbi:hypothetical protein PRIC1_004793 [Phytophthora ramorum]
MVALYVAYPPPPETELGHERARPLPVLTSASKADELSIKMAMQGPEFLPQATSLTPRTSGEARPLLAQSYGVKVTSA